jgi:predicted DNA-binding transcriptional regulator YafY
MPGKFTKIRRMIDLLESSPEGLSFQQLSTQLCVDMRTVKRYLSEIRQAGYVVNDLREAANRESLLSISNTRRPLEHFIPDLKKIRSELHSWGNPKFAGQISQLIQYLENINRRGFSSEPGTADLFKAEPDVYHIDHGPFSQESVSPAILKKMELAILNHNSLKITYSGYEKDNEEFIFFPYCLSLRVGTLYLIGQRGKNKGPFKSLSVKRIKRCISTSDFFIPSRFKVEEYYKYCFGQFPRQMQERPSSVLLQVREKWLRKFLNESHFNPPGRIVHKDGSDFIELPRSSLAMSFPAKAGNLLSSSSKSREKASSILGDPPPSRGVTG